MKQPQHMQLISYLQEAADIPVDQLRALMKKDKRVSKIFTRDLQLDEIADPVEFVKTLRYYLFNNRHVLAFLKSRDGTVGQSSNWWFNSSRKVKPDDLTQSELERMQENVLSLFKDVTTAEKLKLSSSSLKTLWAWLDPATTGRSRYTLDSATRRELRALAARPTKAVVLYRGLNFDSRSMEERKAYDGTLEVGSGLQFLRSVREGSRVADLTWDHPTMWFYEKEKAVEDAYHGATGKWRDGRDKVAGVMGFVISTLADPADIVFDTKMSPSTLHLDHKVILEEGKYTCRVVHKFTEKGEVDPAALPDTDSPVASTLEGLDTLARIFKLPGPVSEWDSLEHGQWDAERIAEFQELSSTTTGVKIAKAYDSFREYYNEYLRDIKEADLDELAASPVYGKYVTVAKMLRDLMSGTRQHPTKQREGYSAGKKAWVPIHELSGEQYLSSATRSPVADALLFISSGKRFTDWSIGSQLQTLRRIGGLPYVKDVHRMAGKEQQKYLDEAVTAFFKTMGEPVPERKIDAAAFINEKTVTFTKNASLMKLLSSVEAALSKLKD